MLPIAIMIATVLALTLPVGFLAVVGRFGGVKRFANLVVGWYVSVVLIAYLLLTANYVSAAVFLVASGICQVAMWPRDSPG